MLRPLIPKRKFSRDPFAAPVKRVLDVTILKAERRFSDATRTWKHRPTFHKANFRRVSETGRAVFASHEILYYVTKGTRAHPIRAKRAPLLVFQTGYSAATSPRKLISKNARRFGPTVRKKEVKHPGTEARDFDKEIVKREQKGFVTAMQTAMTEGARQWRISWGGR